MSYTQASTHVGTIYLRPRPFTKGSGVLILLPLISEPPRRQSPMLPAETWLRVLDFVFTAPPYSLTVKERSARLALMRVSKTFKNLVSSFIYAHPYLDTLPTLKAFTNVLHASDQAWDSLRRIPYSTPGRWVHTLDLSCISCITPGERLAVDTMLTCLFPLTPFLEHLTLNSTIRLSRRAINALVSREGIGLLRTLSGIKWEGVVPGYDSREDPLLHLISATGALEELELFGPGLQDDDFHVVHIPQLSTPPPTPLPPLSLPKLHSLKLLSMPNGLLLESLLRSSLPALRHVMVTPYDDVSSALTSEFVAVHGEKLASLAFHTPKTWPPIRYTTPSELLRDCPKLQVLSLTHPLPLLTIPSSPHPIQIISLPRPDHAYLWKLEAWLSLGRLENLREVHMRDTRWIRPGVSHRAAEAGIQGEMREWKQRLSRWKVRVLDVNGREHAP